VPARFKGTWLSALTLEELFKPWIRSHGKSKDGSSATREDHVRRIRGSWWLQFSGRGRKALRFAGCISWTMKGGGQLVCGVELDYILALNVGSAVGKQRRKRSLGSAKSPETVGGGRHDKHLNAEEKKGKKL